MRISSFTAIAILIISSFAYPQTGGTFDLSHSVIASGGGTSTGGQFTLDGTVGQGNAGSIVTGGTFNLRDGFWAFEPFAPTAASVSVGGRARRKGGSGIPQVFVTITDLSTNYSYQTQTNQFGYYNFANITAGETYIVSVWHKQFQFNSNTRIINVHDARRDVDFIVTN